MSRGAFNTTCDIFSGPETGTPGASVGTFDCRLVDADGIFLIGPFSPDRVAWMTIADEVPVGPWQAGSRPMNPGLADQIAIPSGSDVQWWVLYTDVIDWLGQDVYYRANLVALPLPTGGEGCTCLGALPLLLGVTVEHTMESVGDKLWYEITLEPGDYHVIIDNVADSMKIFRKLGPCNDLQAAPMGQDGCTEFTIDEPDPVRVSFQVEAFQNLPETFTLLVDEGACP